MYFAANFVAGFAAKFVTKKNCAISYFLNFSINGAKLQKKPSQTATAFKSDLLDDFQLCHPYFMQSLIALFHFASKQQIVQLTIKHVWVVGAAPLKHDAGFKYFSYFCGVIKYDKDMRGCFSAAARSGLENSSTLAFSHNKTHHPTLPTTYMEIEGLELKYNELPSSFARCFCDSCPRAAECLRHAIGSLAPAKAAIGKCVYPQSATVEGGCPYFRPICTQRLAWGFTSLFRHVPACKSAMLRLKVMDCFGSRSTYYRYHSGRYLLTPSQQQDVLTVFARAGYDPTTLSFDHYVTQIAY